MVKIFSSRARLPMRKSVKNTRGPEVALASLNRAVFDYPFQVNVRGPLW